MHKPHFIRHISPDAFDDRTREALFRGLYMGGLAAERGIRDFLSELKDLIEGFGIDPVHRAWCGAAFDLRSRYQRDPDLNRELELGRTITMALSALEHWRDRSLQACRALDDDVAVPENWFQFRQMAPEERLAVQRRNLRQAERAFGAAAAHEMTQVLAERPRWQRVLNVSDRFDPRWPAAQSFAGGLLARRLVKDRIEVDALHSADIAAVESGEADEIRLKKIVHAHGPHGAPKELKTHRMDLRRLSFPSEHFDAVLSHGVLDHLVGHDHAFDALVRVAKPGAPVVLSGHHVGSELDHWVYSIGNESHFDSRAGVSTSASGPYLRRRAENQGHHVVKFAQYTHAWVLVLRKGG